MDKFGIGYLQSVDLPCYFLLHFTVARQDVCEIFRSKMVLTVELFAWQELGKTFLVPVLKKVNQVFLLKDYDKRFPQSLLSPITVLW
jgi:hypothetical protein